MTLQADRVGAVNLSQGMPNFPAPDQVKEAACAAIRADRNQYSPPFGMRELREAVSEHAARFLNLQVDPETEVTITCGSTEAMFAAVRSLTQVNDRVIIPSPYYENYWADCMLNDVRPQFVRLLPPEWHIDLDELKLAFEQHRPRLILLCNPNNPTGTVYRPDELAEIARLCVKYDVTAVTDEVYEHIVYDDNVHRSIAAFEGMWERSVTISSASKTFSVTGWRIGTVLAPPAITQVIRQVHDYLTICAPAPLQIAIAEAYRGPDSYYQELASDYKNRRERLYNALTRAGLRVMKPEGAYYILADVREFEVDDTQFAERLLEQAGVATVPAFCFFGNQAEEKGYIRFCFCKDFDTLDEAARRLHAWRTRGER
jgi:aminotransferase